MIALVRGNLAYKSLDHIIVDVGGIGYRLFVPLSSYYALPESGEVSLHVHTHVREDALLLYGFMTMEEKDLFSTLIGISGIGPKLAINILSHSAVDDLKTAICAENVTQLSSLPGIGKKTAERLVLELKDKIGLPTGAAAEAPASSAAALDPMNDIISALVNLGYKENQARKVLGSMEVAPDSSMEQILKGALKVLVR